MPELTQERAFTAPAFLPAATHSYLERAAESLREAITSTAVPERYAHAHVSALRATAALLASAGPALGIGDPVRTIEAFDAMSADRVEEARAELVLPAAYRNARRIIARHG